MVRSDRDQHVSLSAQMLRNQPLLAAGRVAAGVGKCAGRERDARRRDTIGLVPRHVAVAPDDNEDGTAGRRKIDGNRWCGRRSSNVCERRREPARARPDDVTRRLDAREHDRPKVVVGLGVTYNRAQSARARFSNGLGDRALPDAVEIEMRGGHAT